MYLGIAYGTGMLPGTDYIAFRGTGRSGVVEDLIEGPGYGYSGPVNDTSFDYEIISKEFVSPSQKPAVL